MTTPTPPRLTGNPTIDNQAVVDWAWRLYQDVVVETRIVQKLDALKEVELLDVVISNPPTQLEVNILKNKINEMLNAIKQS